jgi:hypothetical protein
LPFGGVFLLRLFSKEFWWICTRLRITAFLELYHPIF